MIRRLLAAGGIIVCATGFARQTNEVGTPLAWGEACPLLEIGAVAPDGPDAESLHEDLEAAIDIWQSAGCTQLPIRVSNTPINETETGFDGRNLVITRAADYCDQPENLTQPFCLNTGILATTTVYSIDAPGESRDGEILETDLEVNLAFAFSQHGEPGAFDLRTILIHEMGHIIGLEHSCTELRDERKLDPSGHEIPACTGASEAVMTSMMFPRVSIGEARHELGDDERHAICLVYNARPPKCHRELVAGWTCSTGGESSVLLCFFVLAFATRRRAAG